jgi:hypothetical protein
VTDKNFKYAVDIGETTPLNQASKAVRDALTFINQRLELVSLIPPPFNEVLSIAYMEAQKIAVNLMFPLFYTNRRY